MTQQYIARGYPIINGPIIADTFQKPRVTNVYKPTANDLWRMRASGVVEPVEKIVEVTNSNGTVKVALDENGTVVNTEKKPALTGAQMAMLAVGAFLLFGG